MKDRLKILDIWVDPLTREQAVERVSHILKNGTRPHAIFASNPEKNFSIPADPELHRVYGEADMLLPDGIGMVYAARLLYNRVFQRIPGSEFIFDICALAAREGHGVFVYGAKEEVNAGAVKTLEGCFPGLTIAGREHGYVRDMEELVRKINESGARILFLALGSPRQEKWFAVHGTELTTVRVVQGIGGTLDTITGHVKRAPEMWCRLNLEWLFRLMDDPRRIKRQRYLPVFAALVMKEKMLQVLGIRSSCTPLL